MIFAAVWKNCEIQFLLIVKLNDYFTFLVNFLHLKPTEVTN